MIYEIKINSDSDIIDWERLLIKESDIDQIVLENDGYSIYLKRPLKYNELLGTDEEEEIELFLWFTEKTLNSPIVGSTLKKLENLFGGTIPPNLGFEQIPVPFEKGGVNKDALIVKYQTTTENGTFNYILYKYSKNDLLPDIFQIPKKYKKVKKL